MKVLIFATHPIQYQVPVYRELSSRVDLTVVYLYRQTDQGQASAGFNVKFEWDIPLYEGYDHIYLTNLATHPTTKNYNGIVLDKKEIRQTFEKYRPDKVIIHGWFPKGMRQVLNFCHNNGYYSICRGDSHRLMHTPFLKKIAKEIFIRNILRKFTGFLVVGRANREFYRHYGVEDHQLGKAYHCVNTPFFEQEFAATGKKVADKIRIGFAGKLIPVKRPLDLLKAVNISAYKPEIEIVIVGDGPLKAELEKFAEKNNLDVTFTGFLNQTEIVSKGYARMDVLALPSESETWGLVVNEVMTGGIPAIVSDRVGCHFDLIDEGETGYVFSMGSPAELSRKVDLFIESIRQGKSFSKAVKEKMPEYSLAATVQGYLSLLDQ